jgi:predicted nucleic acid-binding protein
VIAVDTSVWIDHLNDARTPQVAKLRDMINNHRDIIVVGDLVLSEVLQGLSSDREAALVEAELARFAIRSMVGGDIAIQSAANYRMLRERGVTVRKTIDVLIGTFCIENGLPLLHSDRDFDHMEQHLGLDVVPI